MTADLAPVLRQKFFSPITNLPVVSGMVYTYQAGTLTNQKTYTTNVVSGGTENTNPILLDANGECDMHLVPGQSYKINVTHLVNGVQVQLTGYPIDNVIGTDSDLRADLANTSNVALGDALIGVHPTLSGAIATTLHTWIEGMRINVKSTFGAKGDGVTDDTAAFLAAMAFLQTNSVSRGGTLHIPAGTYIINQELAFAQYAGGSIHSIFLEGDGPINTVLNFAGVAGTGNGISFTAGTHFGVKDLSIYSAPGHNLLINSDNIAGGPGFCSFFEIANVRLQGAGISGLRTTNSFMGTFTNMWSRSNGQNGFEFDGFHTSINATNLEASGNTADGYVINGLVYSHFQACGSDDNTQHGWALSNLQGVTFTSCGAENNQKEAFLLTTSDASAVGIPPGSQDIHGVVFQSCFTIANSKLAAGTYGSFITASTSNNRPMDFKILGGASYPNAGGDRALILAGSSGKVTCIKELFYDANFAVADSISGTVEVKNLTEVGLRTICGLSAATQSIANNTLTNLSINTSPTINDLGATFSGSTILIPKGVNKVRITYGVGFAASAAGVRQCFPLINGAAVVGIPSHTANAVAVGDTLISGTSSVIAVSVGDAISVQVYQSSGGALNVNQGAGCFLAVEAIC